MNNSKISTDFSHCQLSDYALWELSTYYYRLHGSRQPQYHIQCVLQSRMVRVLKLFSDCGCGLLVALYFQPSHHVCGVADTRRTDGLKTQAT